MQLLNPKQNPSDYSVVGTIEICINHIYGTVCDDEEWDYQDATIACAQLGYSPYGNTVGK